MNNLSLTERLQIQQRTYLFKEAINTILQTKRNPTIDDFSEVIDIYRDSQTLNVAQLKLAGQLFGSDLSKVPCVHCGINTEDEQY